MTHESYSDEAPLKPTSSSEQALTKGGTPTPPPGPSPPPPPPHPPPPPGVLHHLEGGRRGEGESVCTQQKLFAQITSKVPTTLHFRLPNFDSGTSSEI